MDLRVKRLVTRRDTNGVEVTPNAWIDGVESAMRWFWLRARARRGADSSELGQQTDPLEPAWAALRLLADVAISFSRLLFADSRRRWSSGGRGDR